MSDLCRSGIKCKVFYIYATNLEIADLGVFLKISVNEYLLKLVNLNTEQLN